jgi:hypothetical protein
LDEDLTPLVDDQLLQRAAKERPADPIVSVVFLVFSASTGFWFCVPTTFGITVAYLHAALVNNTRFWFVPLGVTTGIVIGLFVVIAMWPLREGTSKALTGLLLGWACTVSIWIGVISSLLKTMAVFQLCMMYCCQCIVAMVVLEVRRSELNPALTVAWMGAMTVGVWLAGLWAFIDERDWVSSIVILLLGALGVGYNYLQMCWASDRYNASNLSKLDAVRRYFTDTLKLLVPPIDTKKSSNNT